MDERDELEHAAPQYYDPVKAHEYYERTKELKGRQKGEGLTDKQKEAFNYSKSEIGKAKKDEQTQAAEDKRAAFEVIRQTAERKAQEISAQLDEILAQYDEADASIREEINAERVQQLTFINDRLKSAISALNEKKEGDLDDIAKRKKAALDRITKDTREKIEALPPLPKGNSPRAQRLRDERRDEIAKIREDSALLKDETSDKFGTERDAVRDSTRAKQDQLREAASDERESVNNQASEEINAVADEIATQKNQQRGAASSAKEQVRAEAKELINRAQDQYEALKQELMAKYEEATATEFDAIKTSVR